MKKLLNVIILIVAGGGMLILSIWMYNYILKGVYGQYSFNQNVFSLGEMSQAFSNIEVKAVLVYSKSTENFLPEGSTWIPDNINVWERFLTAYKIPYTKIFDYELEQGKHKDANLMILPSCKSMTDAQIRAVKMFMENGGSVFATSGTGSISGDGKWRGWYFLMEVFGVEFTKELPKTSNARLCTIRGGNPIASEVPTGFTLKIATWDNPVAVQVLDPRTTQLGFWYDFRIDSGLVAEEIEKTASLVSGSYGNGKFIWFGFDLVSLVGESSDYLIFDKLMRNCLYFLAEKPIAFIRDWPGNFKAAAVIVPIVGDQPDNIKNLLPVLRSNNVKASFFINSSAISSSSSLVKQLATYGDVGGIVDVGYMSSVNDTVNKLFNLDWQKKTLKEINQSFQNSVASRVSGIKPLYGLFDDNTLMAMAEAGIKYVITDSLTDRSVPKFVVKGKNNIITITKSVRDDIVLIKNYNLTDPELQLYTYMEDVDRIMYEGGLYVFKIHSDLQCRPEYVGVVGELIKYMRQKGYWITSIPELYNWWTNKNKIELRIELRGPRRIVVAVTNVGADAIPEILVPVQFQENVSQYKVSTEIIGTPLPGLEFVKSDKKLLMKINNLKPGQSRIYNIDYQFNSPNS